MKTSTLIFFLIFFSNLFGQNFYEKYHIDQFISSTDLSNNKETFEAFKVHLIKYNKSFDKPFRDEYKRALGFSKRIPDFPLAMAYYRDAEHKTKLIIPFALFTGLYAVIPAVILINQRNIQFINSLKAYHNEMVEMPLNNSKSPWEQDTQEQNPWD